ncbi:hypothetical protein NC651_030977 [Populus alba x Populus x berolinensis]|nr:hypothetical protein NC651_030977 [Populus alba x Populus x berolinensis]
MQTLFASIPDLLKFFWIRQENVEKGNINCLKDHKNEMLVRYIDLSLMQFVKDLRSTASIETPNFLSRMPTSFSKNTDSLEPISTALDSPLV